MLDHLLIGPTSAGDDGGSCPCLFHVGHNAGFTPQGSSAQHKKSKPAPVQTFLPGSGGKACCSVLEESQFGATSGNQVGSPPRLPQEVHAAIPAADITAGPQAFDDVRKSPL